MKIREDKYNVSSQDGTLSIMKKICIDFNSDCKNKKINLASEQREVYEHLRSMYQREKGEIIQRPLVTDYLRRCDCDCQTVYLTCCAMNSFSISEIFWVICGTRGYTHIFPFVEQGPKAIFFDMLPQRSFNENFPYRYRKIKKFSAINIFSA